MRAGHIGINVGKALVSSNMLAVTQPPSTARPKPPDTLVTLDIKFRLNDIQLLGSFVLVRAVRVVKPVIARTKSLKLKEGKT